MKHVSKPCYLLEAYDGENILAESTLAYELCLVFNHSVMSWGLRIHP